MNIIDYLIQKKISLSPLAGVSDLSFRLMCRKYGCDYAYTEMVDARAILYANRKTFHLLDTNKNDKPLGTQIIGSDKEDFLKSALICQNEGFDMININAACPVLKVKRKKKGSYLLKNPEYIGEIIKDLVKHLDIPVVLKIRSGIDKDNINYLEVGKIAQDNGVKAIFIHPRTATGKYKSSMNKEYIKNLKDSLSIPVIANGNILSEHDAKSMMDDTRCDGISIARGCFGRPWIFRDIKHFFKTGKILPQPALDEVKKIMLEHFELMYENTCAKMAIPRMYKHITWYLNRFNLTNLNDIMKTYHDKVKERVDFKIFLQEF